MSVYVSMCECVSVFECAGVYVIVCECRWACASVCDCMYLSV